MPEEEIIEDESSLDETNSDETSMDDESEESSEETNSDDDTGDTVSRKEFENMQKQFLDTKKALTQESMSRARLEGMVEAGTKAEAEAVVDIYENLDLEDLKLNPEKLIDVIKLANSQTVEDVKAVLGPFANQIAEQIRSQNPDIQEYADEIAELRQDADFAAMSDEALLKVAKRSSTVEKKVKKSKGKLGGKSVTKSKETEDIRTSAKYQDAWGDLKEEKAK